jgi:hypothetical protein
MISFFPDLVEFYPEPRGMEAAFREATAPFAAKPASK